MGRTLRFVHHTDVMRFLVYYIQVTKRLSDTKYRQTPNQTVLKLKGTPYDTL